MPLPTAEVIKQLGDRRRGIGFDQLLLVSPPQSRGADAYYHVYNADGEAVEQCGNGARCVARFVGSGEAGRELLLDSPAGPVAATLGRGGRVTVDLGEPNFLPTAVPLSGFSPQQRYELPLKGGAVSVGAVSVGNPHVVVEVDDVDTAQVGIIGPQLATHSRLPSGANVGFLQACGRDRVKLRVYERGVGETPACGTGAAAAVAIGIEWGVFTNEVTVELPGGELVVSWQGPGSPLKLSGPTQEVFRGTIDL